MQGNDGIPAAAISKQKGLAVTPTLRLNQPNRSMSVHQIFMMSRSVY